MINWIRKLLDTNHIIFEQENNTVEDCGTCKIRLTESGWKIRKWKDGKWEILIGGGESGTHWERIYEFFYDLNKGELVDFFKSYKLPKQYEEEIIKIFIKTENDGILEQQNEDEFESKMIGRYNKLKN